MKRIRKLFLLLFWTALSFFSPWAAAGAHGGEQLVWNKVESKYCIIHYQSLEDLEQFEEKIVYPPGEGGLKWLFSDSGSTDPAGKIARKVDAIFEKAEEILDMRKKFRKVTINLYSNKDQLGAAYEALFKETCGVRSWYLYELKTIYTNVSDVHAGMLAHEMAHHIVDHYLIVRPPRATAEILARYVDKYLNEEIRKY